MTPMSPLVDSNEPPFLARRDGALIFFVQLFIFAQVSKKYSVVERFIGKKYCMMALDFCVPVPKQIALKMFNKNE